MPDISLYLVGTKIVAGTERDCLVDCAVVVGSKEQPGTKSFCPGKKTVVHKYQF